MSSSVHIDNKKKDILILGAIDSSDDTSLAAEEEYYVNFTRQQKKFCVSFHYNGVNSCIFANGFETYKFKAKDSEINAAPLCLSNVSKDFSADDLQKTGLYRYVYDFSVDYDSTGVDDILDIHKYLMKKYNLECLGLFKKCLLDYSAL